MGFKRRSYSHLAVSLLAIVLFSLGWGAWSLTVASDNATEMIDALRTFHGDVPYKDFIPAYGSISLLIHCFLLLLSTGRLCIIWIFYGTLSIAAAVSLIKFSKRQDEGLTRSILFLCIGAYAPIGNCNWPLAYSQSAVLGGMLLMMLAFCILKLKGIRQQNRLLFIMGLLNGSLPLIKVDYAAPTVACGAIISVYCLTTHPKSLVAFLFGNAFPTLLSFAIFNGLGHVDWKSVWWYPTLEALGTSTKSNKYDYTLPLIIAISLVGFADIVLHRNFPKTIQSHFTRRSAFWLACGFSLLPLLDIIESISGRRPIPFQFIFTKYALIGISYWMMIKFGFSWLIQSWRDKTFKPPSKIFILSSICSAAAIRSFMVGFSTIPFLFGIMILPFTMQLRIWSGRYQKVVFGTLLFSSVVVLITTVIVTLGVRNGAYYSIENRFGKFRIHATEISTYDAEKKELAKELATFPSSVLTGPTAEMYILSGKTPLGVYQTIFKLSQFGEHGNFVRETKLIENIEQKSCQIAVFDTHKFVDNYGDHFGVTYCTNLISYLNSNFTRDSKYQHFLVYRK